MTISPIINIGIIKSQWGISVGNSFLIYGKVKWDVDKKKLYFNAPKYFI